MLTTLFYFSTKEYPNLDASCDVWYVQVVSVYQYCGFTKSAMVGGSTCSVWSVKEDIERIVSYVLPLKDSQDSHEGRRRGHIRRVDFPSSCNNNNNTKKQNQVTTYAHRGGGRAKPQRRCTPSCKHHRIQGSVPIRVSAMGQTTMW